MRTANIDVLRVNRHEMRRGWGYRKTVKLPRLQAGKGRREKEYSGNVVVLWISKRGEC